MINVIEKFKKINWLYFLPVLAVLHLWSFAGMTWPIFNTVGFVILSVFALFLALADLRLAILLLFLELIIGSKGYIFSLPIANFELSIRITLWLIIMMAWAVKFVLDFRNNYEELKNVLWSKSGKYFLGLIAACAVSIVIGLLNNKLANVFFDSNNWFFLLIALPLWTSFKTKEDLLLLLKTFVIGAAWLALETLVLAYIFSHNFGDASLKIYAWLRRSGLAEITWTPNGFWRIFLQSQLYLLLAFLALQLSAVKAKVLSKNNFKLIAQGSMVLAALYFSLSRSLWLGLGVAMIAVTLSFLPDWKKIWRLCGIFIVTSLGTCLLVWLVLSSFFGGGGSSFDALLARANITTEAAASSRWNLLPVIWRKITVNPILGQGFGATVIYQSRDPRILEKDPSGNYETYAFEWGWLDLWLKLGLWGMLIYLLWLLDMIKDLLKLNRHEATWLAVSLIALIVIHFFTPYLNHPLGLIVVIISAGAVRIWREDSLKV